MIENLTSLGKEVGLPIGGTMMSVSVHKGNSGALILAGNFPPQSLSLVSNMQPRLYGFVGRLLSSISSF